MMGWLRTISSLDKIKEKLLVDSSGSRLRLILSILITCMVTI